MVRFLALFCMLGVVNLSVAAEKLKLPSAEDREKAGKLIRDLFKAEYAQTSATAKASFAKKLFQQAEETKDDTAAQFMLFKESAELASAGDIDLALRACEQMTNMFSGNLVEMMEPTLKIVSARVTPPDACQAAATYILKLADELLASNDFEAADRFNKMADTLAFKSKNLRTTKIVVAQAKEIDACKTHFAKTMEAIKVLDKDRDDPAANLTVGSYFCFLKGEWEQGLPLLAKGTDKKLKEVVDKDLKTKEEDAVAMAAVADGWYDYMETLQTYPKRQIQIRVLALYNRAVGMTTGLNKTRLEKRIEELEKVLQTSGSDLSEMWTQVRLSLRDKGFIKFEPMGGAFGDKDYSEIHANGGILIGFNYTLKKFFDKDLIDCFQPIYLTPTGEKMGPAFGNFKGAAKTLTLKAKPGYAIGKMAIRGGGLWGGVNVVFMRIEGKNLKPDDNYESGWIGHKDVPNSPFLGDGRPIVGIHGKLQRQDEGGGICSIGLFVVGDKPGVVLPKKKNR